MKAPNPLDYAKKVVSDYPYLFTENESYSKILETVLAMAILNYSIDCDKYYQSLKPEVKEESKTNNWQHGTLPPIIDEIIDNHFNIKTT